MDRIIDDEMLKNVIEEKKHHIGYSWLSAVSELGSSLGLILTAITADFSKTFAVLQPVAVTSGVVFLCVGIYHLSKCVGKNRYNHRKLYNDITDLDKSNNKYSIVALANTFDPFPTKWLLRCDSEWNDTFLFFSYKTKGDNIRDDISNIRETLARELKVEQNEIVIDLLKEKKNHKKYSPEHKREKVYDHRFYQATIKKFPNNLKSDHFFIDQMQYKWMSFEEMKSNSKIKLYNLDVVDIFETETRLIR